MIEIITNPDLDKTDLLLRRPTQRLDHLMGVVQEIFDAVKNEGDCALRAFTSKFDKADIDQILVSKSEIANAKNLIPEELKDAIQIAKNNIYGFHSTQKRTACVVETIPGIECWRKQIGIDKVGLYIPGGSAPLFSTVLMLGIPAVIAGCQKIVLCTPPSSSGEIHPAILYTADLLGISEIYKVGGIQAIAAMTFGTESVPGVYKIFGPGNSYVTAAKEYATRFDVAIDMPAGPSEVMVLADKTSNPRYIASDLLSQAEHGPDSQCILLCTDLDLLYQVRDCIEEFLKQIPRKEIALFSLKNSKLILVPDAKSMMQLANEYAPEHLIIATQDSEALSEQVRNAGSVFIGPFAPESFGDYASGTNHALPTAGFAKAYSGVSLDSFVKNVTFQKVNKQGFNTLANVVETMAEWEQLDAHKLAVTVRR